MVFFHPKQVFRQLILFGPHRSPGANLVQRLSRHLGILTNPSHVLKLGVHLENWGQAVINGPVQGLPSASFFRRRAWRVNQGVNQGLLFPDEGSERFAEDPLRQERVAEEHVAKSRGAPVQDRRLLAGTH